MLSPETWEQQRAQACKDLALDTDPAKVVANLAQALDETWREQLTAWPRTRTSASSIATEPTGLS